MESATILTLNRSDQIDYVSRQLPSAAGLLARLLVRQLGGELSRSEVDRVRQRRIGVGGAVDRDQDVVKHDAPL